MSVIRVAHVTTIDMSLRHLLLDQLLSLSVDGYQVVGVSAPGPDVSSIQRAGIPHIPVPMTRNFTPFADLKSFIRLYRTFRNGRFAIVHTHTPKPGLLGQLAARFAGVPIVVNTLHGFYFHDHMPPLWRCFYITAERIAALCSDVILSQNNEDIETAIAAGICTPDKIKYLGNGIDIHRFDRDALDRMAVLEKRRQLGLPPGASVVGFVGRLVAEKGILEFFQAARNVLDHLPTARFLIVGPFDYDKPDAISAETVKTYGIEHACVFAGMRQDMPEMYALMDLLVLPSHREGFPRAPMEASAMQVPCVVTDIRGCREAVLPGLNGELVPLGDVSALSAAILRLLGDFSLAQRMGQEGRRIAQEKFDQEVVFSKVKSEYSRLLAEKRLSAPHLTL